MNQRHILAVVDGTTSDGKPFLVIVREGDEVGEYLVQGDAGFAEAAREVACAQALLHHRVAEHNRRLREAYQQQQREEMDQ